MMMKQDFRMNLHETEGVASQDQTKATCPAKGIAHQNMFVKTLKPKMTFSCRLNKQHQSYL